MKTLGTIFVWTAYIIGCFVIGYLVGAWVDYMFKRPTSK